MHACTGLPNRWNASLQGRSILVRAGIKSTVNRCENIVIAQKVDTVSAWAKRPRRKERERQRHRDRDKQRKRARGRDRRRERAWHTRRQTERQTDRDEANRAYRLGDRDIQRGRRHAHSMLLKAEVDDDDGRESFTDLCCRMSRHQLSYWPITYRSFSSQFTSESLSYLRLSESPFGVYCLITAYTVLGARF